jgi:hypothetical protein
MTRKKETNKDAKATLKRLAGFVEDAPVSTEEAQATVASLGVDIGSWAAEIQAKANKAFTETATPTRKLMDLESARVKSARKPAAVLPRSAQIANIEELIGRAKTQGATVAAHFRKLEEATDTELAEIAASLAALLDDEDA